MRSAVYIVGPTGSGKSALAAELAQQWNGEIINADAFQVYRRLEILTAQPTAEDRAKAPHHLYGIIDPIEETDAARHATLANAAIEDVLTRNRLPIVVSGSGMYVKALTHGMHDLPSADDALRRQLDAMPIEELGEWLCRLDPDAPQHVNLKNPRHVQRAIEISLLTGKPASEFKQAWKQSLAAPSGVFLHPKRAELYERIDRRTFAMFAAGVVEEVTKVVAVTSTAEKTIGFREIHALLDGALSREETVEAIQQATRRYAKRQVTWFKRETCFLPAATPEEAKRHFESLVTPQFQ